MANFTKEQLLIVSKLKDFKWRIENLYFIVDENWEKIKFKPNFIQREIIEWISNHWDKYIRHIILKYRQGWVSTLFILLLLDEFLWSWKNIYNVIIAHERKLLVTLFKKIRFALDNIPKEYKIFLPPMEADNANELFVRETNNRLAVTLDIRWETPTRIHITELAWREFSKQASLLLAINPLRKTKITIESTANWVWDPFYNLTMKARVGEWTYKLLFYPWYIEERNKLEIPYWYWLTDNEIEEIKDWDKIYKLNYTDKEKQIIWLYELSDEQIYWRRIQIEDAMALWENWNRKFNQENPDSIDTAFIASWTHVFDLWLDYIINKPIEIRWDFKIYWPPEDCMCFGIDTAEWWKAWDYSVIVWKNRKWKTLITFKKRCEDFQLAEAMDQILNMKVLWKSFLGTIQVERNKWSTFVAEARRYKWFYLMLKGRDQTAIKDTTKEYYWFWTWKSKELLIRDYRKGIYNWDIEMTPEVYNEISTFIYKDWKSEAMSWKHDDLIMWELLAYNAVLYEPRTETYRQVQFEPTGLNKVEKILYNRRKRISSWENKKDDWNDGI